MTPDSQDINGGTQVTKEILVSDILDTNDIEGLTITGGEPFIQAKQLVSIINNIKEQKDLGIIIYTGFKFEQLKNKNDKDIDSLLFLTDILIDGLYDKDLNDDKRSLIGSTNQKIYQLTSRYDNVFEQYYHKNQRDIEIHMNDSEMMIVGIPKQETLKKIEKRAAI